MNPIILANTLAILDLVGHALIHIWVLVHPESYEYIMQVFVAGLRLSVDPATELTPGTLLFSSVLEAAVFWSVGYLGASLYNYIQQPHYLSQNTHPMTTRYFLGEFHKGTVNRGLHLVGFFLVAMGVWNFSILAVVIGSITQELGHIYQHIIVNKRKPHLNILEVLLWQIVAGGIVFYFYGLLVLLIKHSMYAN